MWQVKDAGLSHPRPTFLTFVSSSRQTFQLHLQIVWGRGWLCSAWSNINPPPNSGPSPYLLISSITRGSWIYLKAQERVSLAGNGGRQSSESIQGWDSGGSLTSLHFVGRTLGATVTRQTCSLQALSWDRWSRPNHCGLYGLCNLTFFPFFWLGEQVSWRLSPDIGAPEGMLYRVFLSTWIYWGSLPDNIDKHDPVCYNLTSNLLSKILVLRWSSYGQ